MSDAEHCRWCGVPLGASTTARNVCGGGVDRPIRYCEPAPPVQEHKFEPNVASFDAFVPVVAANKAIKRVMDVESAYAEHCRWCGRALPCPHCDKAVAGKLLTDEQILQAKNKYRAERGLPPATSFTPEEAVRAQRDAVAKSVLGRALPITPQALDSGDAWKLVAAVVEARTELARLHERVRLEYKRYRAEAAERDGGAEDWFNGAASALRATVPAAFEDPT